MLIAIASEAVAGKRHERCGGSAQNGGAWAEGAVCALTLNRSLPWRIAPADACRRHIGRARWRIEQGARPYRPSSLTLRKRARVLSCPLHRRLRAFPANDVELLVLKLIGRDEEFLQLFADRF